MIKFGENKAGPENIDNNYAKLTLFGEQENFPLCKMLKMTTFDVGAGMFLIFQTVRQVKHLCLETLKSNCIFSLLM